MSEVDEFVYEAIQDAQTIKDFLKALLEGVEKGKIVLTAGDKEILLHPADLMMFAIKASRKPDTSRLTIRISWREASSIDSFGINDIEITT